MAGHTVGKGRWLAAVGVMLATGWSGTAQGLEPADIAVVFNHKVDASSTVAAYYAHARGIPRENVIGVECTTSETITEVEYRNTIAPAVRKGLADRQLTDRVKCLVTVYGMPLAIGDEVMTAAQNAEVGASRKQLAETLQHLDEAAEMYDRIASTGPGAPATTSRPGRKPGDKVSWPELVAKLNTAATAAGRRVEAMEGSARAAALAQMEQTQRNVAGITGILNSFSARPDAPENDPGRQQLNALQTQLTNLNEQMQALAKQPSTPNSRAQMVRLQTRARGWIGEAQELQLIVQAGSAEETGACFDNELALVLTDQLYPRARWLANTNNVELYPQARNIKGLPKSIMVCRLDGLTPPDVTHMIDVGIAVEKTGLEGKLYLDARGMHGTDAYAIFDADIRAAADWLKSNSTIEVVLDDRPEFFEAKNCPDAALYCGWYSLHHYLDSCQWVPGAVGYHVASYEMESLHSPTETGWVSNLLRRGFCGTLGATSEPYLTAFPKPSKFFPLLLCGEFTQGEVWEVTSPMTSWRIAYVGDPLYNPYRAKPRVKMETIQRDTVLRNALALLRPGSATKPATP